MDLTTYLTNHGAVLYLYNDTTELQTWIDSVPNHTNISILLAAVPFAEKAKLFQIRDVAAWYGKLCDKINNNTEIEIQSLGINSNQRKKELQKKVDLFIAELVSMDLLSVDMQGLLQALMTRSLSAFSILTWMFVADDIISELTLGKLQVEFSPYKRWQTLGLTSLPSLEELEVFFPL